MKVLIFIFMAVGLLSFAACKTEQVKETLKEEKVVKEEKALPDCSTQIERMELQTMTLNFPATGSFIEESHLATKEDTFPNGRLFPNSSTDGMQKHLDNSCPIMKVMFPEIQNCMKEVYGLSYQKVWTPPENGLHGQGSVGNLKPSVEEEMFSGNMYWTRNNKPKPGEKWLVMSKETGKQVVFVMGYETGPGGTKWIGGLQPEVFYALGAKNNSTLTIGRLKDQTLALGPIKCGKM